MYTQGKVRKNIKGKKDQEPLSEGKERLIEDGTIKENGKTKEIQKQKNEGTKLKRINKGKIIDVHKKLRKINLKNLNNMTINFGGTVTSFYDNVEQLPPDVLIAWQKSVLHNISHNSTNVKMKELISLLRYSNYDSDVFYNMRTIFLNLACYPNINGRTEKDILLDIKECYKNYYSLKNDEDIADVCGHLCIKFGKFKKSIYYLKESLRKFKDIRHSSTYINIASCYKILGNYKKAVKFIKTSIQLAEREKKRNANTNKPSSNNFHSSELLYSIQFCNNPVTYAIIGVNHYIQNDGLYYLTFENRIKLKYIFLLSKTEEKILKLIHKKLSNSPKGKSTKNVDFADVLIIKVYNNNSTISVSDWENEKKKEKEKQEKQEKHKCKSDKKEKTEKKAKKSQETCQETYQETGQETNNVETDANIDEMKSPYLNWEKLKTNLELCLKKFDFQFCVIDAPWNIKPNLIQLVIDHLKHIYTYGVVSDNFKQSIEVILKYKEVAKQLSWINNNYMHDDCIYEARKVLTYYIQKPLFLNIVHFSKNAYTNINHYVDNKEILIDELCIFINKLSMILDMGLVSVTANILTKNKKDKTKASKNLQGENGETNQVSNNSTMLNTHASAIDSTTNTTTNNNNNTTTTNTTSSSSDSDSNSNSDSDEYFHNRKFDYINSYKTKENENKIVASLTGSLTFVEKENEPSSETIHGSYMIINDISEEFVTKIKIVGTHGVMTIKTSLTSWTLIITDCHDEKVYEKSGRISTSQNANDIFINQYLIKTNGKPNKIKHISEYVTEITSKNKKQVEAEEDLVSEDSDNDILIISDEEEDETAKSIKRKLNDNKEIKETTQVKMANDINNNKGGNEQLSTDETKGDQPIDENNAHTQEMNCNKNNTVVDSNLQVLKELPGSRFYYVGKEIYENMNLDKCFVDMTVNSNGFVSTYVEGILFSINNDGRMVTFVPRS